MQQTPDVMVAGCCRKLTPPIGAANFCCSDGGRKRVRAVSIQYPAVTCMDYIGHVFSTNQMISLLIIIILHLGITIMGNALRTTLYATDKSIKYATGAHPFRSRKRIFVQSWISDTTNATRQPPDNNAAPIQSLKEKCRLVLEDLREIDCNAPRRSNALDKKRPSTPRTKSLV